ncbi:unnamed protein product [Ectocarpus sp. CCAP 1310/34]|nr:unnamed protein product [Ectocarpus sp. CCAP 1310/34]
MIFFKRKEVAVVASTLLLAVGFTFRPASAFSAAVRPTALRSATHPAAFFSAHSSSPAAARPCRRRTAAECCNVLPMSNMVMSAAAAGGRNDGSSEEGKAVVAPGRAKKVIKSAGVALAWYLASSAVALAATAATGGAARARPQPRMRYTGLPILLMAYALSRGDLKERTRLEGVVPRDPESIKLLADDAEDLAMSWGKPAGLMAYTSVDCIVFFFLSRWVGFPFKELVSAQRIAHLQTPDFWVATTLAGAFGFAIVTWTRRVGQGYLRSVCASALSPAMHRLLVRPAKAVASVAGMGDGWDLGLTDEQRKARRPSIELRRSLSTFKDPDFHGDGGIGDSGGAAFPQAPSPPPAAGVDDGAPPDLKRSS